MFNPGEEKGERACVWVARANCKQDRSELWLRDLHAARITCLWPRSETAEAPVAKDNE